MAVYTRQSRCAPIRVEEGITGILTNPNSSISYRDLPREQRIGGYLTPQQLEQLPVEAATLDSEGRCLLLEFPVFVLIGVYSPANRDDTRDDFRLSFVNALDFRIRNLIGEGKEVFLTGDINISREDIDAAHAEEALKKNEITAEEFVSTPARRIFNQLLIDGKVVGDRDEGREKPMLWDICRGFHPGRRGMYTCWEQKVNARPGNYGARIDYVLCSTGMKDWFYDANIQEGLMVWLLLPSKWCNSIDKRPGLGSLSSVRDDEGQDQRRGSGCRLSPPHQSTRHLRKWRAPAGTDTRRFAPTFRSPHHRIHWTEEHP